MVYTNADVLTKDKIEEIKDEIRCDSPPDIIAITEIKSQKYERILTENDYKIDGYKFEPVNLDVNDSSRGLAIYVKHSLKFSVLNPNEILDHSKGKPKELICIDLQLAENERMMISNIYRSPHNDASANDNINKFLKKIRTLRYEHQIIVGDFNRKDINWKTVSSSSEDDMKFIEAARDSFLIQHIKTPTRGRGTNKLLSLTYFLQQMQRA